MSSVSEHDPSATTPSPQERSDLARAQRLAEAMRRGHGMNGSGGAGPAGAGPAGAGPAGAGVAAAEPGEGGGSGGAAERPARSGVDRGAAASGADVARSAAGGATAVGVQVVAYKVLSFFGQIALTHLLMPEHTGQMTLALGIAAFTNFTQQAGLREVLLRLRVHNPRWDAPAVWLSATLGLIAALLTGAAAFPAGWSFNSPVVTDLLLIVALAAPCSALATVPEARLQSQMRFWTLMIISFLHGVGVLGASLALAYAGLGAYALAIPVPAMALLRLAALWAVTRPPLTRRLHVRRWRYLVGDSLLVSAAALVLVLITQAGAFVLGRFHDEATVGIFAFAMNLSLTTAVLLSQNVGWVLLPVLSTMQDDPSALRAAFTRSARILHMLAVPLCVMQAALAEPFVRLFCGERFAPSVPVMEVLSIAMAAVVIWPSSRSLIQAQGRFLRALGNIVMYAVVYVAAVAAAARFGGAVEVAWAVLGVYVLIGLYDATTALRPLGGGLRDVLSIVAAPVLAGALGVGGVWLATATAPGLSEHLAARALLVLGAGPVLCVLIYRLAAPRELAQMAGFLASLLRRFTGRGTPARA